MMGAEKVLVNVNKGQDPYNVIGNYILNHVTAIEDIIAVIRINGVITNELYMVDVDTDRCFYWNSDWWEGEENVALIAFFPVSDSISRQAEIIHCKDCKHNKFPSSCANAGCEIFYHMTDRNGFCSLAERREV